jgi:hypothetical protein
VLSGTDYTPHLALTDIFELHKKWVQSKNNQHWRSKERDLGFYEWVMVNTQCIQNYALLKKTVSLFNLEKENVSLLDSWYTQTLVHI